MLWPPLQKEIKNFFYFNNFFKLELLELLLLFWLFVFTSDLFKTSRLKCIIHTRAELCYCAALVWIINFPHRGVAWLQKGVCAAPFFIFYFFIFFLASLRALNCKHNTPSDGLSGASGALVCSAPQFVRRCNLGNTGESLCFGEPLPLFDVYSGWQRCCAAVTPWWKHTNPCREPTKRGCCIAFSSAKVCLERECVLVCVWGGDFFQLSYWNYTGSHCITGASLNHSFRRASSLADFDTALTQCIQLTHFNDHVDN